MSDKRFIEKVNDEDVYRSKDGNLWNSNSKEWAGKESSGKTSEKGDIYDEHGDYKGRRDPETGKVYDTWGDRVRDDDD